MAGSSLEGCFTFGLKVERVLFRGKITVARQERKKDVMRDLTECTLVVWYPVGCHDAVDVSKVQTCSWGSE